jgi:SOS-response transcriptional repressor LexA
MHNTPRRVSRPYRERQEEAMAYIRRSIEATGKFPTKTSLARSLGMRSPQSAREMLERLMISGYLRRKRIPKVGWMYEVTEKE